MTLVEALLTLPIVLLMIAAMVEISFMMVQWNQSVKALQVGVRLAAVSTPVMDISPLTTGDTAFTGTPEGDAVPQNMLGVSCTGTGCDTAAMDYLMTGPDGVCGQVTAGVQPGICDIARFLSKDNIQVTYIRSGLGYVGRPNAPVLTIRLELVNKTFDYLMLAALVPGISSITFPPHTVSITSEDMLTCREPTSSGWPNC
ncbi:pilus assembly protein [Primorskyibacter aestuariivivens]|uniref:TadE/TadG family type IV pilus assembly protein n=1 Tax=Primorskyibacter aestuariivivens TaxID=1888912 RepID=UPI002300E236|nr:TadE family protein [Primorskyibacter aestuariivivens]MDA7427614.1 pilus assembly protein [Primorskyibacter aestuariivivens]